MPELCTMKCRKMCKRTIKTINIRFFFKLNSKKRGKATTKHLKSDHTIHSYTQLLTEFIWYWIRVIQLFKNHCHEIWYDYQLIYWENFTNSTTLLRMYRRILVPMKKNVIFNEGELWQNLFGKQWLGKKFQVNKLNSY